MSSTPPEEVQLRDKGAQEIQCQGERTGQSNVATEFRSELFPSFPDLSEHVESNVSEKTDGDIKHMKHHK